jgi:hypothetical protein
MHGKSRKIISLKGDTNPYYVNGAHSIAFAARSKLKRLLDEWQDKGFIEPIRETFVLAALSSTVLDNTERTICKE